MLFGPASGQVPFSDGETTQSKRVPKKLNLRKSSAVRMLVEKLAAGLGALGLWGSGALGLWGFGAQLRPPGERCGGIGRASADSGSMDSGRRRATACNKLATEDEQQKDMQRNRYAGKTRDHRPCMPSSFRSCSGMSN